MGKLGEILSHPDELVPMVRWWAGAAGPLRGCLRGQAVADAQLSHQRQRQGECRSRGKVAAPPPPPAAPAAPASFALLPAPAPQVSMALAARRAKQLPKQPGLAFCYDMLNRVSRRCGRAAAAVAAGRAVGRAEGWPPR